MPAQSRSSDLESLQQLSESGCSVLSVLVGACVQTWQVPSRGCFGLSIGSFNSSFSNSVREAFKALEHGRKQGRGCWAGHVAGPTCPLLNLLLQQHHGPRKGLTTSIHPDQVRSTWTVASFPCHGVKTSGQLSVNQQPDFTSQHVVDRYANVAG